MNIQEISRNKGEICEEILRSLPEWFGIEESLRTYVDEARFRPMFVAREGENITGFLTLTLHNEYTGEIHVMGIRKEYHRKGIGKALVEYAASYLLENKHEFMTVKTLSSSRECPEYERTRKFYLALGFKPLEEFKTLWGKDNPCLFLARSLTRRVSRTDKVEEG